MSDTLDKLAEILEARKSAPPDSSYVAGLYAAGLEAVLEKVDEEAAETIAAAREDDPRALVRETADLWFHTMIMLTQLGCSPVEVLDELQSRFGTSGLDEKAARGGSD